MDREAVFGTLGALLGATGELILGDCPTGVDDLALSFAKAHKLPFKRFKADWTHYGKAAGPMRNSDMLDQGCPHALIAFRGGRGTQDCAAQAKRRGIPVAFAERGELVLDQLRAAGLMVD